MRLMQAIKRKRFLAFLLPGMLAVALTGVNEARAAITYQTAGTIAYSATNGATVAPGYPTAAGTIVAGDLLVLIVGMKPSTANSGSVTTPTGWTPITSLTGAGGYGTTLAADTGNTNVFTFYKVAAGGETGTLTVTLATNNVSWAQMYRLTNATGGWGVAGTTGSDTTGGAAVSIAMSADPGVTAGDFILGAMVIPTNAASFSGEGLLQTGITFGTVTEISEPNSGNGNDIGGFTYRAPVNLGTASAAPTLTATAGGTTTNVRGPGVFIRAREVPVTTTLATGADPAATTIAPGAVATDVNLFTLQTDTLTEAIGSVTVNLSTNSGVGRLAITNNAGTELGFTTTPATGSNTITVTGMSATTTLTTFRVRVTPLSHALMPAPATGAAYDITAPVTAWAGLATHTGSDTNPDALTIDNLSPANVTGESGTAGNTQVTLNWTNPADTDLDRIVVLRNTVAVTDTPVEGRTPQYVVGDTVGASTVACVVTSVTPSLPANCTSTGLTNGTTYHYKIFAKDSRDNYSATGVAVGPFVPFTSRFAVAANGNWSATSTWSTVCGGVAGASVPTTGDNVTICSGSVVTFEPTAAASVGSLTVAGTLRFGNNNTARTLTVTGNITITGTLNVNTASNTTHSLVVGGDITNNGTLNLATDSGSLCNTTFNKNGSQLVSGNSAVMTRFNRITLDMGTTNANILEITAANFSINPAAPTNFLILTNGTFKFSTAATITPFTSVAAATIDGTTGFWLNNASAIVQQDANFDWTVTGTSGTARGLLKVSSGTLDIRNSVTPSANNDLIADTFSEIVVDGGTVTIGGALTRTAAGDNILFNMSAGTLTVGAAGAPGNYSFRLGTGASFTMSGGTIVVRQDGGGSGYENLAATTNVTGGTLQIGDASTPAGRTMDINSSAPIWNFTVNNTNSPTARLVTNNLTVRNNVTIGSGGNGTLNANNLNITVGGSGAGASWTNNGAFTPGTGTVTFNDSAAQGITGVTTFNNLVINNAAGVTANSNLTINGNFTNTAGFNAGTTLTTFSGTALQTLAGATTFYDLTFNNAAGFTLSNSMTASNALTLTSGVIATGTANALIFSSTSTCAVTRTSGRVNGNLRKNFDASFLACDFEIGDATNYTPVNVAFSATGFSAGTVTAKATGGVHPEIGSAPLDSTTPNLINRYWILTPGGALAFSDVTLTFTPVVADHDNTANVGNYTTQRYQISSGPCDPPDPGAGSWNGMTEPSTPAQTTTLITATGATTFGGICSHFAIGVSSVSGFLYEKEFIYTREVYY